MIIVIIIVFLIGLVNFLHAIKGSPLASFLDLIHLGGFLSLIFDYYPFLLAFFISLLFYIKRRSLLYSSIIFVILSIIFKYLFFVA